VARAYEEVAVDALHTTFSASYASTLSAIDSSVTAPVGYVKAFHPADNRSPLVQIYDRASEPAEAGQRNELAIVDCDLIITYNGGTNTVADEAIMRKYCEAVRTLLMNDPTLGGAVAAAFWTELARDFDIDSESQTRHVRAFGIEVQVHDP